MDSAFLAFRYHVMFPKRSRGQKLSVLELFSGIGTEMALTLSLVPEMRTRRMVDEIFDDENDK